MNSLQPFFDPTYLNLDYLFNKVYQFFHAFGSISNATDSLNGLKLFLSALTVFLIGFIMYVSIKMFELRHHEHEHMAHEIAHHSGEHGHAHGSHGQHADAHHGEIPFADHYEHAPHEPEHNPIRERWETVTDHLRSANPAEWRLAIIEADSMLDEVLESTGYKGENIGERLKDAEGAFRSVQSAWNAHKVRNQIAHQGSQFELTHHEALVTIDNYKEVFEELKYL
jgi:hypothetical protein